MIWIPMTNRMPPKHRAVLLYRTGTLYPVVGARWGRDPHGHDDRELYTLEEGGPEDGIHRGYPFLDASAEPTHWAALPATP